MQNFNLMTMTPYILFVGMLAARLTSASSFLVAKDSLVSLTENIIHYFGWHVSLFALYGSTYGWLYYLITAQV